MSTYSNAHRSTSSPPPSKRPKRPNKLFRACVQCVTSKTRCEDVITQGCSVCRRKGKDCSLAGAIVDGEAEKGVELDVHASTGDFIESQLGRGDWQGDNRGYAGRRAPSVRASSHVSHGPGVMYPPMHPLRHASSDQGRLAGQSYENGSTAHSHGPGALGDAAELHERIVQSETRIRQLEDRVSTLQSLALTRQSSHTGSAVNGSGLYGGAPGGHTLVSSTAVSPFQSPLADHLSVPNQHSTTLERASTTAQQGLSAESYSDAVPGLIAATDHITATNRPHRQTVALIANVHSRYRYSFNGGWIVSAYTPPSSFCLITQGYVTADEVEVAWTAFQQNMATRLPLSIWSLSGSTLPQSGSDSLGLAFADIVTEPAEHPYLVIAMMHHVSPYNKRKMRGYSLAQAADEIVKASLKPLSRAGGDSTLEVLAALLVLSLAPTLPDVEGGEPDGMLPVKRVRPARAGTHGEGEQGEDGVSEACLPRPSPAKYVAMALQLGRDSGLQSEVENIIKIAGDDLIRPEWREAYVKVELWMAIVSIYNLLQTMQSHRAPIVASILPLLPSKVRSLNPDLYHLTVARQEIVRLAHTCSEILDRIEDDQPAESEAKEMVRSWRENFDQLVSREEDGEGSDRERNPKLAAGIQLDRDCVAQALIVRLAMLIQHLPSPLAPLRATLMPLMSSIRTCAETMFRHVVPDDHLAAIKSFKTAPTSVPGARHMPHGAKEKAHAVSPSASPLLKLPAYVAQCTLLGYMTMQGTVVFMRNMLRKAREQQLRQVTGDGASGGRARPDAGEREVVRETEEDSGAGGRYHNEVGTSQKGNKPNTRTPTKSQANGNASTAGAEIEAEIANIMDMTRFDQVALRLRRANGVYGVILDSLNVLHRVADEDKQGGPAGRDSERIESRQPMSRGDAADRNGRIIPDAEAESGGSDSLYGRIGDPTVGNPTIASGQAPPSLGAGAGYQVNLSDLNAGPSAMHQQSLQPGQANVGSSMQASPSQYPIFNGGDGNNSTSGAFSNHHHQQPQRIFSNHQQQYQVQQQPQPPPLTQTLLQPFAFDPNLFDADLFGWDLLNMGSEWNLAFFGSGDGQG